MPDALHRARRHAARILVVLDDDPFSAPAIDHIGDLRELLPTMLQATGLQDQQASLAGQTGLADETVQESLDNVLSSRSRRCSSTCSSSCSSCAR